MASCSKLEQLARVAGEILGEGMPGSLNFVLNRTASQDEFPVVSSRVNAAALTADTFFLDDGSLSDQTVTKESPQSPELFMQQVTRTAPSIGPSFPLQGPSSAEVLRMPKVIDKKTCHFCFRQFREAFAVRKHIWAVHHKTRNFACSACGQRFAERSNLKKHVSALHKNERPHECEECGKRFHFTDGLSRHVRNCHLGLRPFACDRCGFRFKQRTHLQKHQKTVSCRKA